MTKTISMDQEACKEYLLSKPKTGEDFPFGPDVAVYRVMGKMFATLAIGKMGKGDGEGNMHWWMNLKCDPDEAFILRDIFPAIIPGYHMSKTHWNTIILDDSIPEGEIQRMMDNSYELIVSKMTKKNQAILRLHS